jgi:4'-phosphopantetheinyl transferase EntD
VIGELFPPEVAVVCATPEMEDAPLHPDEAAVTGRMAVKRLREYTLGRACAREALALLEIEDFALVNDAERVPVWPDGIVGSLTHSRGLVAAAAARWGAVRGVGLDIERGRTLEASMLERICAPSERARLQDVPVPEELGGPALLAFSAKEAFYKCYYPIARTFLGFLDAEISFSPAEQTFTARLLRDDAPAAHGARVFHGRYALLEAHVATAVTLTEDA